MVSLSTFDLIKEPLRDILEDIKRGKIQLPNFQRDWRWEDERVRRLINTISLGCPIGWMMFLQQDNFQPRLQPRLIEGVDLEETPPPKALIIDGQQRLTSLFMSLLSGKPVVINRGKRFKPDLRWYYFDIRKALTLSQTERINSVFSFKPNKQYRLSSGAYLDCSTSEKEYQLELFPVSKIFYFAQWRSGYSLHWNYDEEKLNTIGLFEEQVVKKFEHYQLGLYILRSEISKEAISYIFLANHGVPCELTHFDLLTCQYSAQNYNLREDWALRENRFRGYKVLRLLKETDFLQALSLVSSYSHRLENEEKTHGGDTSTRIGLSRQDILDLDLAEYKRWADVVTDGFEAAAKFLHTQAIYDAEDLTYPLQLIIMSSLFAILGKAAKLDVIRGKLEQWFYCGATCRIYSRNRESMASKDLLEVPLWLNGKGIPTTIREAYISLERLQGFVNPQGSTFAAIAALLRRDGALDFMTGEKITSILYFDDKVENHHIFPQKWCKKMNISRSRYNSIVNKTPLGWKTNRFLGGNAPSEYLNRLESKGLEKTRIDEILRSHLIEPEFLRKDDFEGFFETRSQALSKMLDRTMGKA